MKPSDIDNMMRGIAPALIGLVEQAIDPIQARLSELENGNEKALKEFCHELIKGFALA